MAVAIVVAICILICVVLVLTEKEPPKLPNPKHIYVCMSSKKPSNAVLGQLVYESDTHSLCIRLNNQWFYLSSTTAGLLAPLIIGDK